MTVKDWESILSTEWVGLIGEDSLMHLDTQATIEQLNAVYNKIPIFPYKQNVFNAFRLCPADKLKVVVLGQDPYPNSRATGLAFANNISDDWFKDRDFGRLSSSLGKVAEAISRDFGGFYDPSLESQAKNGVLWLNSSLTVERNKPGSHRKLWAGFIQRLLIQITSNSPKPVAVLMWGKIAQSFEDYIHPRSGKFYAEHPVAAARRVAPWICNNFKEANQFLFPYYGESGHIDWPGLPF